MTLNFKNDISLGNGEEAKAITNFNTGEQSQELSHENVNTKPEETLNKFFTLLKTGNKLASELFEKLNDPILSLRGIINDNIEELK